MTPRFTKVEYRISPLEERKKNVQRDNSDTRSGEEEEKTAQVLALIGA